MILRVHSQKNNVKLDLIQMSTEISLLQILTSPLRCQNEFKKWKRKLYQMRWVKAFIKIHANYENCEQCTYFKTQVGR